jgi:nicotinate-nucleotide adenylyltransferase
VILFGGTFDPVHNGHLYWAERIRQAAGVNQIYFLPCRIPVHKARTGATSQQRLTMLQLACADQTGLLVDDCELQRDDDSFTVLTLREKKRHTPERPLYWVVGQDSYNELYNWREPTAILSLATLIVMLRPGCGAAQHPDLQQRWQRGQTLTPTTFSAAEPGDVLLVDGESNAASATAIRAALRAGANEVAVPAAVLKYIREQQLYVT